MTTTTSYGEWLKPKARRPNDLVIRNMVVIPVLWRNVVSAASVQLRGTHVTTWTLSTLNLVSWYRA
jgi:hypothetical protein